MDGNFDNREQNGNTWQAADGNSQSQGWQDAGQSQGEQNRQTQNPYYGSYQNGYSNGYNNYSGGQPGGYPNGTYQNGSPYQNGMPYQNGGYQNGAYPNPNMPNQGYAANGGYNNYAPNGYNGPIVVSNAVPPKSGGLALGSLVCGIISILCFWSIITILVAIIGVVLGIVNVAQGQSNKGLAIAGIITGCLAIILTIAFLFFLAAL